MSEQGTTGRRIRISSVTNDEVKSLLNNHHDQVNRLLSDHQREIKDHVSSMGQYIVQGFEKVGDKIAGEMKEFRTTAMPAATGAGKLDAKVIMPVIYTLCAVITALIVWFTGVKPFIPGIVSAIEGVKVSASTPTSL